MIDKYRLEDMRRESGENGELARWVIQLQADLDREIRKSASERAMLSRLAVIMHGSETDLNLLTVTAQSLMDRCKANNSPVTPDGYVLVPIVPTEDMIINGFESVPDPHFSDEKEWKEYEALSGCRQAARRAELCWAAMIKAAPKQENI